MVGSRPLLPFWLSRGPAASAARNVEAAAAPYRVYVAVTASGETSPNAATVDETPHCFFSSNNGSSGERVEEGAAGSLTVRIRGSGTEKAAELAEELPTAASATAEEGEDATTVPDGGQGGGDSRVTVLEEVRAVDDERTTGETVCRRLSILFKDSVCGTRTAATVQSSDEKSEKKKTNSFSTGVIVLKSFVGGAFLFLPHAVVRGGVLLSLLTLTLVFLLALYCMLLLVSCCAPDKNLHSTETAVVQNDVSSKSQTGLRSSRDNGKGASKKRKKKICRSAWGLRRDSHSKGGSKRLAQMARSCMLSRKRRTTGNSNSSSSSDDDECSRSRSGDKSYSSRRSSGDGAGRSLADWESEDLAKCVSGDLGSVVEESVSDVCTQLRRGIRGSEVKGEEEEANPNEKKAQGRDGKREVEREGRCKRLVLLPRVIPFKKRLRSSSCSSVCNSSSSTCVSSSLKRRWKSVGHAGKLDLIADRGDVSARKGGRVHGPAALSAEEDFVCDFSSFAPASVLSCRDPPVVALTAAASEEEEEDGITGAALAAATTTAAAELNTYEEVGKAAAGVVGERVIELCVVLSQLSFATINAVIVAANLRDVVWTASGCDPAYQLSMKALIWSVSVLYIPLSLLPRMQHLVLVALLANIGTAVGLFLLLLALGVRLAETAAQSHWPAAPSLAAWDNWPVILGTSIYMWEGAGLVLPIRQEANRRVQKRFPALLCGSLWFLLLLYIAYSLVCCFAFGKEVEIIILFNLPPGGLGLTAQTIFASAILATYPLMMFPALSIIEKKVKKTSIYTCQSKTMKPFFLSFIRAIMVVLSLAGATLGMQQLDDFVALVGGLCGAPLVFVFPVYFHMKLKKVSKYRKIFHILVIGLGLAIQIFSVYSAVTSWKGSSSFPARCLHSPQVL